MTRSIRLRPCRLAICLAMAASAVFMPRAAPAQDAPVLEVWADRDMTPLSGTADLLAVDHALAAVEDRWLPASPFDESTGIKHALGVGYRIGKWFALDLPQDHLLMVVGHEVFGHGARLREIGAHGVSYGFDAPIPYGGGGAVTEFRGDLLVTRADALGIDTGGIEAQNVLAGTIGRHAIEAGTIGYRDAWLYLESRLDGLRYIRSVSPRSAEGHDVRSFLIDFNDGCDPPVCSPISASTLKRRALSMLADPMLAYAGYGWAYSYFGHGRSSSPVPMIPLPAGVRYLPALRFEMTPYGTAITTEHTFARDASQAMLSVGVGDTGRTHAWQIGVATANLIRRARWRADLTADVWRQPSLDTPPDAQSMETGVLGAGTLRVPLGAPGDRASVLVEAGYKSDGFIRGERLHSGPIIRIGIALRP
jgi:hypothetical protein